MIGMSAMISNHQKEGKIAIKKASIALEEWKNKYRGIELHYKTHKFTANLRQEDLHEYYR